MRRLASFLTFAALVGPAPAQESALRDEPVSKFGISPLTGLYPQTTPKAALGSVVNAVEKERFDYVVAHLLDDAFVETRIGKRAVELLPAVDAELRAKRERQRLDPASVPADQKLSMEPKTFAAAVDAEVRTRAFKLVVKEAKDKLGDDPEAVKELKRFARDGAVAESGDTATISLRDVKERNVYLKRVNGRWFVENRQADDAPKSGK